MNIPAFIQVNIEIPDRPNPNTRRISMNMNCIDEIHTDIIDSELFVTVYLSYKDEPVRLNAKQSHEFMRQWRAFRRKADAALCISAGIPAPNPSADYSGDAIDHEINN